MKIKNPKYKKLISSVFVVFTAVILFEIVPGYYSIGKRLSSAVLQKYTEDNLEKLADKLNELKYENSSVKKLFYGEAAQNTGTYNFSAAIEKFSSISDEFDLVITSIKPLKKIQRGRLNFNRTSLIVQGDYNNIYNYCRWLELTGSALIFEEVKIVRQRDNNALQASILVDVFVDGKD